MFAGSSYSIVFLGGEAGLQTDVLPPSMSLPVTTDSLVKPSRSNCLQHPSKQISDQSKASPGRGFKCCLNNAKNLP